MATGIDLYNTVTPVHGLASGTYKTTQTTSIDRTLYGGGAVRVVAVINTDAITDGTFTPTLQDSPDNSTWTNVASNMVQGPSLATFAHTVNETSEIKIGYTGVQRYVQLTVTPTGSPATGGVYSVIWLAGHEGNLPAA